MKRVGRIILFVMFIFGFINVPTVHAVEPVVDIGTLGGLDAFATAINNAGQVVGASKITEDGSFHAFLWENGVMIQLFPEEEDGYESVAQSISENGFITGTAVDPNGETRAFLWKNGKSIFLGTLGCESSYGTAVNGLGQVVGTTCDEEGNIRGFLWRNGHMIDLGTLGGNYTEANDINVFGQVIGKSTDSDGLTRAYIWDNGKMKPLSPYSSGSYGINIKGHALLEYYIPDLQESHAGIWTRRGFTPIEDEFYNGQFFDINNNDHVVGVYYYDIRKALLYKDGQFIDLNAMLPDGTESSALGVNDQDQVVGEFVNSDGHSRAIIWNP